MNTKIFVVNFFGGGEEFVVCNDAARAIELAGEERVKNQLSGRTTDVCKIEAITRDVIIDPSIVLDMNGEEVKSVL